MLTKKRKQAKSALPPKRPAHRPPLPVGTRVKDRSKLIVYLTPANRLWLEAQLPISMSEAANRAIEQVRKL